jgi:hypothetical protein
MSTATAPTNSVPRWMHWTGWLLSLAVVAQLLSSAWFRATHHASAVAEIVGAYGYPESAIVRIVIAECALVVLYLVPQTSVLAAILMTGYLGGAVAAPFASRRHGARGDSVGRRTFRVGRLVLATQPNPTACSIPQVGVSGIRILRCLANVVSEPAKVRT